MDSHCKQKTIAVWISDKKSQKLNWSELFQVCEARSFNLIKLDLERPLEDHGHIDIFLHKLTDIVAAADQGENNAVMIVNKVEQYLSNNPDITVIDPIENVRVLLNRLKYYTILEEEFSIQNNRIFTPSYTELISNDVEINLAYMKSRGIEFPVVCKPDVAHGSKMAHQMVLIFNAKGLTHCKAPCVIQNFVNHNAVLHKVFVVGNRYHICVRPSLKNFFSSGGLEPIFFSTGEVCKADSHSTLSILDPQDRPSDPPTTIQEEKVRQIIKVLQKRIGLLLLGFDVVIDIATGNHAVIDINVFPSYDGFPNFFEHLLQCIEIVSEKSFASIEEAELINVDIKTEKNGSE